MENEEEIEFFGFVPVTLVAELQSEIEGILRDGVEQLSFLDKRKAHRISGIVFESFRRNYFIFSNFVLRNILRFPPSFRLERKANDAVVTIDLQSITDELVNVLGEEDYYEAEVLRLKESIDIERYRLESYRSLLECSKPVNSLIESIMEAYSELENVTKLYDKMSMISGMDDEDHNALLEYREIRSSLAKKERDDLLRIASEEVLMMMNKCTEK
ncbi:hypothetical protein EROM_070570 [Encephalitozoon romaleae SJ-2008]|uniref:Uncharacterized protein n=1 Tax=Encephalitozoon romaleae (strain SJ-2008) TaxID=1178016 RepID=I6ZJ95_ENCRO|nr:hypothetical protein EROM_070570 [Encephalitozoon romaleae SJ-2008]AFN83308.1 hypothetical protein EROM_070570 [Encephalitozoon romaleae SJ-2008]